MNAADRQTGSETDAGQERVLSVFLSYSRDDLAFVRQLADRLAAGRIDVFIDHEDIARSEDWWERICQLIVEADSVVTVLSPGFLRSEVCQREVAFAAERNKRFVPVVAQDVGQAPVPQSLSRLNYIFFCPNPRAGATGDFEASLAELSDTLLTDIAWVREHTRIGMLAERWIARGRPTDLMLRGPQLAEAETWLATRPASAPAPTVAQMAFVSESRRSATRRQRNWVIGSSAVAFGALALAAFAFVQWTRAEEQLRLANAQRLAVLSRAALAEALVPDSLVKPDMDRGALLALESLARQRTIQGDQALREVLLHLGGPSGEYLTQVIGDLAGLGTGGGWFALNGPEGISVLPTGPGPRRRPTEEESAQLSADHHRAESARYRILEPNEQFLDVVDAETGETVATLAHEWFVRAVHFSAEGTRLLTVTAKVSADASEPSATSLPGSTLHVWALPSGEKLSSLSFAGRGGFDRHVIEPTGDWIAVETGYDAPVVTVMPIWSELVVAEACRHLSRPFSPSEIADFLGSESPATPCDLGEAVSE